MTKFNIELDVAHDCTLGEILSIVEKNNGSISEFKAIGPAGGNPLIDFSFPTRENAESFAVDFEGEHGDPDYIKTFIREV